MPEHVVETVRRLEIIELVARADEISDRKHAFAEHREEDVVGHQPGHRHRPPAGPRLEDRVQFGEVGNSRMRQLQKVDSVHECRDDARAEQLDLAREQQIPDGVILLGKRLPVLRDDVALPILPELARGGGLPGGRWRGRAWIVEHFSLPFECNKKPAELALAGPEAGDLSLGARQLVPASRV